MARSMLGAERLEDRRLLAAWAVQDGGLDAVSRSIATSADGSAAFVAGGFRGSASFGGTTLTSADSVTPDIFVIRVNPDGSHAWAVRAGGTGVDDGLDVAASVDGSVLVAGRIGGNASFGTTVLGSHGSFVAKLDASGAFVWATGIPDAKVAAIASLADGASVVTGSFTGTVSFGGTTIVSSGFADIFVARLNPDGSFAWATRAGGAQSNEAADVAVLADGSTLVAGTIRGAATFGGTTLDGGDPSSGSGFVAKLSPAGSFVWATGIPHAPVAAIASFADGAAAVTGSFTGAASFGGTTLVSSGPDGYRDIFVAKLSPLGAIAWATRAGGDDEDRGAGIAALADGATLVTGFFTGSASFGNMTLANGGGASGLVDSDSFVAKLNPDGSHAWATRAGSTAQDRSAGIAAFPDGSVGVTGAFGDTMAFGSTTLTGFGGLTGNIFTARMPAHGVLDDPRAPSGLSGSAGAGTVRLTWVAPAANGGAPIGDYIVQVSGDGGDTWKTYDDGVSPAMNAEVTGLTNGTRYAFRVAAVNEAAVVLPAATYASLTPLGKASPPSITSVLPGDNLAALTWAAPAWDGGSIVTDYRIEVSSTNGASWMLVEDGTSTATDAIVAPLANGTPLLFRVAAVTAAGIGGYSAPSAAVMLLRTWPKQIGGSGEDSAERTVALADGSVLVAGSFQGDVPFGALFTSRGGDDAFVAKLNADGSTAWFAQGGGTSDDYANGLATGPDGSVFVSGYFSGTASFGSTTLTSSGGSDAFFAKVTANGTYAWALRAGGTADDYGNNIAVFGDGCAIVTGSFQGTASFGSTTLTSRGARDIFVAKLNPTGSYEWVRQVGGTGDEWGYGIATLADGSAIITGGLFGTAAFGDTTLSSSSYDAFTAKLAPDGSWSWATRGGGADDDQGSAVATLADGSALVVGSFWGATATFGTTQLAGSGGYDVFVAKLNPDGSYAWATRAGGDRDDFGFGIATLTDGSAVLTGYFQRTATFGGTTIMSDFSSPDAFVAALRPDGSWKWVSRAGGRGTDWGGGIATRADGSAVVAGGFGGASQPGTATFGGRLLVSRGSDDAFVTPIGPTGVFGLLPGTPTSLQAVPDSGQVSLSWAAPPLVGADEISDYMIQYRRSDETGWATVNDGVSTARSVTVGNLAPDKTYLFRVAAVNAVGTGGFSISVTAVVPVLNQPPVDIQLSAASLAENRPAGTAVGTLTTTDPDASNTFTYTLVAGTGDTDNASFNISGIQLRATASLNFETNSSYSVRVRSTDQGGLFFEKAFTITVTNVNETPTDIALSTNTIAENAGENAVVGTLTTTDPDTSDTFTYTLVIGTGSIDNASFNISGNQLRATASLDFETKTSYAIRIRSTDQGGLFTEKTFTITVTNSVNDLYVVTYDVNGGTPANPSTKSVTFGAAYGALAAPTRTGYTFAGWQLSGATITSASTVATAADHTLVASWTGNTYVVTYDVDGGTPANPSTKSVTFGAAYGALAAPTRTGYTFAGWQLSGVTITSASTVATAADHTLVASWININQTPAAPTNVVGTPGNTQVSLSWTAPTNNGGSAIADYVIQFKTAAARRWSEFNDGTSTSNSATVTGLQNGKAYVFRVIAVNAAGQSGVSTTSSAVTPRTVPSAPRSVRSTAGNGRVNLSWTAPSSTRGAAITDYIIQYSIDNGANWINFTDTVSTKRSATVTGLTNGTRYTFRVAAINAAGTGPWSSPSAGVTPRR